jgi:hypothetical protein
MEQEKEVILSKLPPQTFEVVLLNGQVFPKEQHQYIAKLGKYGKVQGYCRDLQDFKNFDMDYEHLIIVDGYEQYCCGDGKYHTSEVISKTAISHYRKR